MFPEFIIAAVTSSVLGWGAMTWKKAETAKEAANTALHKVDAIELKVAEEYLSKDDFQDSMNRLFESIAEIKSDLKYVSSRVDFHVRDQAGEVQELREQLLKAKRRHWL